MTKNGVSIKSTGGMDVLIKATYLGQPALFSKAGSNEVTVIGSVTEGLLSLNAINGYANTFQGRATGQKHGAFTGVTLASNGVS